MVQRYTERYRQWRHMYNSDVATLCLLLFYYSHNVLNVLNVPDALIYI